MSDPKDYADIGHGMQSFHSILWLYRDGKIETHSAGTGTHNSVWGAKAMQFWRGRFDPKTHRLSIVSPLSWKQNIIPQYVQDALETEFGVDFTMYEFNPQGVKKHGRAKSA